MLWFIPVVGALLCAMVAAHKDREPLSWALTGALCPVISIIIVLCVKRERTVDEIWDEVSAARP